MPSGMSDSKCLTQFSAPLSNRDFQWLQNYFSIIFIVLSIYILMGNGLRENQACCILNYLMLDPPRAARFCPGPVGLPAGSQPHWRPPGAQQGPTTHPQRAESRPVQPRFTPPWVRSQSVSSRSGHLQEHNWEARPYPRKEPTLLRRTRGPDPSSKASLRVKTQHEGALPAPCIVRKDPRVPHTARRGA